MSPDHGLELENLCEEKAGHPTFRPVDPCRPQQLTHGELLVHAHCPAGGSLPSGAALPQRQGSSNCHKFSLFLLKPGPRMPLVEGLPFGALAKSVCSSST